MDPFANYARALDVAREVFAQVSPDTWGNQSPCAEWDARGVAGRPVRVALVGEPNAGKSRLFNALIGSDAALVSPAAGTTGTGVLKPSKAPHAGSGAGYRILPVSTPRLVLPGPGASLPYLELASVCSGRSKFDAGATPILRRGSNPAPASKP